MASWYASPCCCTVPDPPPDPYYPRTSYYYNTGRLVPHCWGCGPMYLPDVLHLTLTKSGSCDCLSDQTVALNWCQSFSITPPERGVTVTFTASDSPGGAGTNRGMWVSDDIPALCKSTWPGSGGACDLWMVYKYVLPAGYFYNITQGSTPINVDSCYLTQLFWTNHNYISIPLYQSHEGSNPQFSSCSPLALSWDFNQPFDIADDTLSSVISCNHGCPVSGGNTWTGTVTL